MVTADQAHPFSPSADAATCNVMTGAPEDLDTWSSASRQHYIDTGEYLRVGEADSTCPENRGDATIAPLEATP